ncbi:hypothetical protein P70_00111 [Listeria phage P70]|uniref:Uncharacterized protein n=2 Tax=Homburgvirus TaxID=1921125 RepID=A0A6C0QZX5_9CAUD|nr:hypothetical protein P70_00111 [Listeria phage P70]AFQ96300.1 hypothetical protein P70_00111 [Listeria phage P70]QHZ59441.1 hypothetical protein FK483_0098 [Listeria phage LP-018]
MSNVKFSLPDLRVRWIDKIYVEREYLFDKKTTKDIIRIKLVLNSYGTFFLQIEPAEGMGDYTSISRAGEEALFGEVIWNEC